MVIIVGLILIIAFAVCMELVREQKQYVITKYTIRDKKLKINNKKTVVFLSDLHNHVYDKNNLALLESWVAKLN